MPTENEMRQSRLYQRAQAALAHGGENRGAILTATLRDAGNNEDDFMTLITLSPQHREALRMPRPRRIIKRHLWKAVADGNVDRLRQYHSIIPLADLDLCVNSRTGWTIVHEAVERGHSWDHAHDDRSNHGA